MQHRVDLASLFVSFVLLSCGGEGACPAGLHHSGFSCGNHQPKIFFEIPDVSAAW